MANHDSGYREQKRPYSSRGSMFDDKNRKIPRPMNAFMIFAAENRSNFKEEFPEENNKDISVRLGEAWRRLPKVQRDAYYEKAKEEEREHKKKFPNYVYCPGVARQRKKERLAEKARLDAILKAEIDSVLSETRSRRLGDDLPPIPGYMGGASSPGSLQDMDLFSFGQPYPQASTSGSSMQMFASPQRAGYSPYRQGHTAAASAPRQHPYLLRERCMPVSHYPQPMSRPYYPSPYGQMPPGASHPRHMPPLHRPPYPYPMPHSRPPYMMHGTPAGHYQHFDRTHTIDPGMLYRPWQPQLNQGQVIGDAIPFKREADEISSHSMESTSRADSTDDARQHCTTPSDTSQEAQQDVFLPMQMADSASSTQQLEATEVLDKALPGMHTFIQIPIFSSNPGDISGDSQPTEQSANADSSKATLLSLNGHCPPYDLVMAHYPPAHFGNPSAPFGNAASTASDFVGAPQFYAMKRTPNKHGESGPEMMMSPIRLEQPFYTDRPANESSPFNPKHLPNEFIEQIAKQFYLLQGQGGDKLLQSPIVIASPCLGRGQNSSPARLILSPAHLVSSQAHVSSPAHLMSPQTPLVSSPARLVASPVRPVSAIDVSDPEHPVPASVGSCEEKVPELASDAMEVENDGDHTVQKSAVASVDQDSPAASPQVNQPEDQVPVQSNEDKPPATASCAMEVRDEKDPLVPEAVQDLDHHKSPAQPVDKKAEDPIVLQSSPASEGGNTTNQAESQETANATAPAVESDQDSEMDDRSDRGDKVQVEAASIDGIDGGGPSNHLALKNPLPQNPIITDDAFVSDQSKEKMESVGELLEGPLPMIPESAKEIVGDLTAKKTPDGCGDGPQQQQEPECEDAAVTTVQ